MHAIVGIRLIKHKLTHKIFLDESLHYAQDISVCLYITFSIDAC